MQQLHKPVGTMLKITYITVTYNAAQTIPATIGSVLTQSYTEIEHIIVDGKSADDTIRIASEYREKTGKSGSNHIVRIISEQDKGIYDAMNKGIKMATGDYICFLNAGDWLPDSNTTQEIADAINNATKGSTMPAVVYGDTDIVDEQGNHLCRRTKRPPVVLNWQSFKDGMTVCHQAFYARTDIAQQTPFNMRYKYSADFDWCIRIMKHAEEHSLSLINTDRVLVNYLNEGTTTRNRIASLKERYRIMQKYYGIWATAFSHIKFLAKNVTK